jgi:Uma2 family endonuclease
MMEAQQENAMASAPLAKSPRMSVGLFRAFYATRPDEEQWELIDGTAVMMTPPTLAHRVIAGNLQRLLNDGLERHDPTLLAVQRAGLNLAPAIEDYDPEPDVVVIDAALAEQSGERYAGRFHLVAEIVSASDRVDVEGKREIYKLHEACKCISTVQQDRFEVRIDLRVAADWRDQILKKPDDLLQLPDFGLRCEVSDLYRGTPLRPRQSQRG